MLSAVGWSAAYDLSRRFYSNPNIFYWNVALELATFLAVTVALAAVRSEMRKERALALQLEEAYLRLDDEQRLVGDLQRGLLPPAPPPCPGSRSRSITCRAPGRAATTTISSRSPADAPGS